MSVDLSELNTLEADLRGTGVRVGMKARAIVEKGSLNVKNTSRDLAPSGPHTPQYPASITYDVTIEGGTIVGEIGPDKDKPQGPLGNLLEYGTEDTPPHAHLGPALDREGPGFERALADAGADSVFGR